MSDMPNRTALQRIVLAIVPTLCLLPGLAGAESIGAAALAGTWCAQDASGETITQYSVSGAQVKALTMLSEADPRRIGEQSTLQLKIETPTVFSRTDADEVFRVNGDVLTIETATTQSYQRCDFREAFMKAQAFMLSPSAEAATRQAVQRDASSEAAKEEWRLEAAETEALRSVSRELYYSMLIQQLNQVRASNSFAATSRPRGHAVAYSQVSPTNTKSAAGGE
jgi:hypothetical protein